MKEFSQNLFKILKENFAGLNLVGYKDWKTFHINQIEDCEKALDFAPFRKDVEDKIVCDIGFGGGFPLLVLSYLLQKNIYGFEAREKKVSAVAKIAELIQLKVSVHHQRLENIHFDCQDTVLLFKAVGDVAKFIPLVHSDHPITCIYFKGPQFWEKEGALPKGWKLNWEYDYVIGDNVERKLISISSENVPRGTIQNKKSIVKFSQFAITL